MPIRYQADQQIFELHGGNVSYILHVTPKKQLMHLYWGKRLPDGAITPELNAYASGNSFNTTASWLPYELPTCGTGWFGEPAVSVVNAQGDDVVSLIYMDHDVYPGKKPLSGLPATYIKSDAEAESLEIHLQDPLTGLQVTAVYCIYAHSGAITRSLRLTNGGGNPMTITGAMSASVPLIGLDYDLIHLKGAHDRERMVVRTPVGQAEHRIFSKRGASGHEENPFLALCRPHTTEHLGDVWAVNLVYSGSFQAMAFVDNRDNTRLSMGMNPDVFSWLLEAGETFTAPEAVMVYSDRGLNGMSHIYHELYRNRLARGSWRDRERPVLINTWEGVFFNFNEQKLLDIAKVAAELGIELFVLDDGWFGKRDGDNCSLGDWVVDKRKLPDGLGSLVQKIKALGLQFGIWFEPEMISPDSDLYRAHPDWCLHVEGRPRTEARQQLILDLSRQEVQDYIIRAVCDVLASAPIDYVKWDMNRNMTEYFSAGRVPQRQRETQHRYMLGLYRVLEEICSAFPHVLFESCSGGGGRFDPGMLHYMPQTWTSDNTDAVGRLFIQYGTSFAYPPVTMGAHVSKRARTSLEMRGHVAMGGNFGYELDLSRMSDEDKANAQAQIAQAKQLRHLTQHGVFSRLCSPFEGDFTAWQFVSADQSEALLCAYRVAGRPNKLKPCIPMTGLDPEAFYADDDGNQYSGAVLMHRGMWLNLNDYVTSEMIHLRRY